MMTCCTGEGCELKDRCLRYGSPRESAVWVDTPEMFGYKDGVCPGLIIEGAKYVYRLELE